MTPTRTPVRPTEGGDRQDRPRRADPQRPAPRLADAPGRVRSFAADLDRRLRRWARAPGPRRPGRLRRWRRPAWLRLPAWSGRPAWLRMPAWSGEVAPGSRPTARHGAIDPRIERRRMDVARRRDRRRLAVAGSVAAIGFVLVAGWFLLHSRLMSAQVVTVAGATHTPAGQIVAAAGLGGKPPLIDISQGAAEARIDELPWVLRSTVSLQWPDGVRIAVTERKPVAVVASGSSTWAEVDRSGRVLQIVPAPPAGVPQLFVPGAPGRPGSELGPAAGPGLAVAGSLPPAFAGQVVTVDARTSGELRLQLSTPVSVLLGAPVQLLAKYSDVASILAHAVLHPGDVIDVTVPGSPVVSGP